MSNKDKPQDNARRSVLQSTGRHVGGLCKLFGTVVLEEKHNISHGVTGIFSDLIAYSVNPIFVLSRSDGIINVGSVSNISDNNNELYLLTDCYCLS